VEVGSLARLLHITDPHLFAEQSGELRGTVTYATFERTLAHVRDSNWQPDLIALTGDLIQDDSEAAYDHYRPQLEPFGTPVLCVPGNHDVPGFMQDKLSAPPFFYCGSLDAGNWKLMGIDSLLDGSAGGRVSADELDRLDRELSSLGDRHVAVCLHHPPVPVNCAWLETVGLENRDELLAVLGRHPQVRLALFGHVHQDVDVTVGNVRILGTPSTCRQFKPDSDDFALDDRPPAYRKLDLNDDGSFRSELVWVDGD
jgi:Icc protein